MIKLGIIYGGISTEHDVSIMSAKSVIDNLDKEKYEIHEIYINEYGKWFENDEEIYNFVPYMTAFLFYSLILYLMFHNICIYMSFCLYLSKQKYGLILVQQM